MLKWLWGDKDKHVFGAIIRSWHDESEVTQIEVFSDSVVYIGQKLKGLCKPNEIYEIKGIMWVKGNLIGVKTMPPIKNYVYNEALMEVHNEETN
jgi:hypothetical protein